MISQASHNYAFDDAVGEVMFQEHMQTPQMGPALYRTRPSSAPSERIVTFGKPGLFQPKDIDTGTPEEGEVTQQFRKDLSHTPYALILTIGREAADDNKWGLAERLGEHLGESSAETNEYYAAKPFNELWTGTNFQAEDGVEISGTHTNVDSGNSQTNKGTLALSYANLMTTRTLMRKLTDYTGNRKMHIVPDEIIGGLDKEEGIFQLVMSQGKPGGSNNDLNFARGGYRAYIWPWLDWTFEWAIMDSRLRRKNLLWYQRVSLEVTADITYLQHKRQIGGYERFSNGCVDWRWIYGNLAAA